MNHAPSAHAASARRRLAILLVAIWLGFVSAAFFNLAVAPRLALSDPVAEADFVLEAELWWRGQANRVDQPVLVLLPPCDCVAGAGESLLAEASRLGVRVHQVANAEAPRWQLASSLAGGFRIDTLLFDRSGALLMAFLRSNPDHCLSAVGRLGGALSAAQTGRVWPGWCPCTAPPGAMLANH